MKYIKWKILLISSFICLLPVLAGIILWDRLPDEMAVHFNLYNQPDNFAPKGWVVFGIPILMAIIQSICCIAADRAAIKQDKRRYINGPKWIIPCVSVIIQLVTIGYGISGDVDIRKIAMLMVGVLFIVIGKSFPKATSSAAADSEKGKRSSRITAGASIVIGILYLVSAFLPPIAPVICTVLLIPYAIISIIKK